jgi:hypothetical protein
MNTNFEIVDVINYEIKKGLASCVCSNTSIYTRAPHGVQHIIKLYKHILTNIVIR